MDETTLIKFLASGGLTLILLYAAVVLWRAYQEQVKGRLDDQNARIERLEKGRDSEDETTTSK